MASMQPHALDQLWATVSSRKGADPASSWTAKLLSKGVNKCAQKVGEEATEVVIEAASGNAAGFRPPTSPAPPSTDGAS